MWDKLKNRVKKNSGLLLLIKKNTEIIALGFLILITIISTTYYNSSKKKIYYNYKNIINNIYLKKTVNQYNILSQCVSIVFVKEINNQI